MNNISNRGGTGIILTGTNRNQLKRANISERRSTSLEEIFKIGNSYHKNNQLGKAETIYRKILENAPEHSGALHFLGVIAHQSGNIDRAIELIKNAIKLSPEYHTAHNNLGNIFVDIGELDKATKAFKRAIKAKSDYAQAYYNLGLIESSKRNFDEAIDYLKACVDINPRHIEAHLEAGQNFINIGQKVNAQIAYKIILDIDKENSQARLKLAQVLNDLGIIEEAKKQYEIGLQFSPNDTRLLNGLGRLLAKMGKFKQAFENLHRSLELNDTNTETLHNLGSTHQAIGDIASATDYYKRVLKIAPHAAFSEKCLLFLALNDPKYSLDEFYKLHLKLRGHNNKPEYSKKKFKTVNRNSNRRIRLGYISSDFRKHVVAQNIAPVITNHDHNEFEIFLYSHSINEDEYTKSFKKSADHFKYIDLLNDKEAADLIEKDKIDILITLAGRFDENRPLIATYRPAPIQVSYHDCATSGLSDMDYYFTDQFISPKNSKEKFTEKLYHLPTYYQYPIRNMPPVNEAPVIKNGYITFCCFNKPEKLSVQVIELWAQVLKSIPDSCLMLKYFDYYCEPLMKSRIEKLFTDYNVSPDRLILKAKNDIRNDHLKLYHEADISLDPLPFNGATTTFEALSMGLPVITLKGDRFVSRVTTSMVTHIGRSEFATNTPENYIKINRELSKNPDKLNIIRQNLRSQIHNSSLCNDKVYTNEIEKAYRNMWALWCKTAEYREF